jgi:thiol:disulfide interchange protein DsbD
MRIRVQPLIRVVPLFAAACFLGGATRLPPSEKRERHVTARLLAGPIAIGAVRGRWVGVELRIQTGWHVYWKNPGDAGSPPVVAWTLPAGWHAGAIAWPVPQRIEVPPLTGFGYENRVVLPVLLTTSASAGVVRGRAEWVVCKLECVSEQDSVMLKLGDAASADVALSIAALPVDIPTGFAARVFGADSGFALAARTGQRIDLASVDFFPADAGTLEHSAKIEPALNDGVLTIRMVRSRYATRTPDRLRGLLVYRDGAESRAVHAYNVDVPVAAETGTSPFALLALLGLALVSGLLVNIMPCVFPLLVVKGLSLAEAGTARSARFGWAAVYVSGCVVSSVGLGGSLLFASEPLRQAWGFQMQSPRFVALVAMVAFAAALSLLGVFEVPQPRFGGALFRRLPNNTHAGAFVAGAGAILVGAPCSAPLLGTTIAAALAAPLPGGLVAFACFGLGAAAPFALLALSPGTLRHVPRAGRWMETIKQLLAFPLVATAAWFVWVAQIQVGAEGSATLLAAICAVGFALWLFGRWGTVQTTAAARRGAVAMAITILAFVGRAIGSLTPAAADDAKWRPYSSERLDSLRNAGRAVLVDFTAAWCLTCKVNEGGALRSERVLATVRADSVGLLRADLTTNDGALTRALRDVGAQSVPTYVVYPPLPRSDRTMLPLLLTPGVVIEALHHAAQPPSLAGRQP